MSTNSIDPFDEFEFKPLTDGLGFHKKSVSLKDGLKSSGVLEDELQGIPTSMPRNMLEDIPKAPIKKHTFDDVLSALEKTPLARKTSAPADLQVTEPLLPCELPPGIDCAAQTTSSTSTVRSDGSLSRMLKFPLTNRTERCVTWNSSLFKEDSETGPKLNPRAAASNR